MSEIDKLLAALAREPAPAALEGVGERVLGRLQREDARLSMGLALPAILVAATALGLWGGAPPRSYARSTYAPLGVTTSLTPAALLAGSE